MAKRKKIITEKTQTKVSFFFRDVNSKIIFKSVQDIDASVDFVPPEVNTELKVTVDAKGARGTVESIFRELYFDSLGNLNEFVSIFVKNATPT